ncbi:Ig-like domain-containing protein [Labrenzia sp. PHM005]|uniref:Ig-like domain-containing protein n=1 Tax=Labrenzia sp. PHM005 TaxID=2590016 RepID=UPI0011408CCD|nr:Ig-like domain-containing protein [Labrenzia sp. PHM005]QDG78789.1 hypothetical protein FJ695_24600 [Labrenzia sp. PHM005]
MTLNSEDFRIQTEQTETGLEALIDIDIRLDLASLSAGLDAMTGNAAALLEERAAGASPVASAPAIEGELAEEEAAFAMMAPMAAMSSGGNSAPVAQATWAVANENGGDVVFTPLFTDSDPEDTHTITFDLGFSLSATLVLDNGDGTYTFQANDSYDYLTEGQFAYDNFNFTVTDNSGASSTNTLTIVYSGENDAPVAVSAFGSALASDATASVPLLITDADQFDTHTVAFFDLATGQSADQYVTGTLGNGPSLYTFTPQQDYSFLAAGQSVTEAYRYVVTDSAGGTSEALAMVTWDGVNDAPVAQDMTVNVNEGDGQITFALNGIDPDAGDFLTYWVDPWAGPDGPIGPGTLTSHPDGTVTYDFGDFYDYLGAGQTAIETFFYSVTDSFGESSMATGTIVIQGEGSAPVAGDIYLLASENDTSASALLPSAGTGGIDTIEFYKVEGGMRGAQVFPSETPSGAETLYGFDSQMNYDYLLLGETVTEIYEYVPIENGVEGSNQQIYVTYEGEDDAPVANNFGITVSEDDLAFNFTPDFLDPDANDYHTVTFMPGGTHPPSGLTDVYDNFDGTFRYANDFDAFGYLNDGETATETFEFTVTDSNWQSSTAIMTVTIVGQEDPII